MPSVKQLIHEAHRRSLWQVLGLYVVVAWIALQVVDVLANNFGLPPWFPAMALALLILGLPVVLATAFVQTQGEAPESAGSGGPGPAGSEGAEAVASGSPDWAAQPLTAGRTAEPHGFLTWRNALIGGGAAFALWGIFAAGWLAFGPERGSGGSGEAVASAAEGSDDAPDLRSIAVLPFTSVRTDEESESFRTGIHDDILTQLSKIDSLKVISRTSVRRYENTEKGIPEIAKELKVATVLEGGVQRAGDEVRVNVQLIEAASDRHLWAETYERALTAENIFDIQSDIAHKIAGALRATLAPQVEARLAARPTESLEAYDLYTRGRYISDTRVSRAGAEEALGLFKQAIEVDPDYPQPYVGLASAYLGLWAALGTMSGEEALPKARAALDRALTLDETFAEAHSTLGVILSSESRFEEAERELKRALELNPGSGEAHMDYARMLINADRYEESAAEARRAIELDPLSVLNRVSLASNLFFTRDFEGAIDESLRILELEPDNSGAYYFLSGAYSVLNRHEEAIAAAVRSVELDPNSPARITGLAYAYARAGQRDKALEVLAGVAEEGQNFKEIAIVYGALGELDRAFEYLDRALEEDPQTLSYMRADATADPITSDPRFDELEAKLEDRLRREEGSR